MFKKSLFLLLLIPFLALSGIDLQSPSITAISRSEAPQWVLEPSYSLDPPSIHPSQVNEQILLLDTQNHIEEKTFYLHRITKILTQKGVENLSQLRFSFDPSYEQLMMHTIRVYRAGQWSDRMNTSTYKIIQREGELDHNLYNGNLSLIYFLDDIQIGDVLEYSCSFIGEHPVFSPHFTRNFSLQEATSIEKIHRRILGDPTHELSIKPLNTDIEPKITVLSPYLQEWVWETSSTKPYEGEPHTPSWYNPLAKIQISDYQTWSGVAQLLAPFYALSPDLTASCPTDVIDLVARWKEETNDPAEQTILALRFVQDYIRYQGFEDGEGAFKPTNPWIVFSRRFGDCKDKTLLLRALLKLLDIESIPVLVHTLKGKSLPNDLPSPFRFDHVILEVVIDETSYWIDSTMHLQGGPLQNNHLPDYHWGLPLSTTCDNLFQLPVETLRKPTEIDVAVTVQSPDKIELSIKTTCFDGKADKYRRYLTNVGLKQFSEDLLTQLKRKYGVVSALSPLSVTDDRKNNILIMHENYLISLKPGPGKKIFKPHSFVLSSCLDDEVTLDRASPYALYYPLWIKERITITNPYSSWASEEDDFKIENHSMFYQYSYKSEEKTIDIQHEIRHLKDHLPVELVDDYWYAVDEIRSRNIDKVLLFSKEL